MKNQLLVSAMAATFALVPSVASAERASSPSSAQGIDQVSPFDTLSGSFAIGGYYGQKLAQVVTIGRPPITAIQLPIGCDETLPNTALTLTIVGVTVDGLPGTNVLATERYPAPDMPNFFRTQKLVTLSLSHPLGMAPGSQFAFVLESDGSCGILPSPKDWNLYRGGLGYYWATDSIPPQWIPSSNGTGRNALGFQTLR